jgi:6-pyruvoyltetrahydropterin/6-carboxytetrahydropterin synthase
MPRCSVTRRVNFNAAHRLHNPAMPEAWNRETFGPCNNPSFHGHNYDLDVSVEGEISPATGYVMDLTELKRLVEDLVLCRLDHQNLNVDVPWFADLNPTAENIAVVIWRELRAALPSDLTLRIRLWETPRNYVDYSGDA